MAIVNWHTGFLIGLIVLASVSFGRYKGPSWVRSYTSAARFYSGLVVYLISQVFVLYVLAAVVLSIESLTAFFTDRWLNLSELRFLTPIVFAALLAWGLPLIPQGRRLVVWHRDACRRIAGSPAEAYALSRQLASSEFVASEELESTVRSVLVRRGWDPDQSWLPVGRPVQELWFKTSLLYELIREWDSEPRYARFLDDAGTEFDIIRKRYDQVSMKVVRTFQTIERFGTVLAELSRYSDEEATLTGDKQAAAARLVESKSELRAGISDMLSDVRLDIEFLYENICLLVARAVLINEKTAGGRFWRLRNFGFLLERSAGTTAWIFPAVFGLVICVLFLAFTVFGTGTSGSLMRTSSIVVMIGAMQVVALLVAILPKQYLGFANVDIHGRTPFDFILGTGIATFILALPVSLLFRSFIYLNLSKAFEDMIAKLPWLVMPCVTSMALAYLIQDNRWHSISSELIRRALDAVFLAFAMSLAYFVVKALFVLTGAQFVPTNDRVLIPAILGLAIGFLVPHFIRDRTYLDDEELKEMARKSRRASADQGGAIAAT